MSSTDPSADPGMPTYPKSPFRVPGQPDPAYKAMDGLLIPDEMIPELKARANTGTGGESDTLSITMIDMDPPRQFALRMPTATEFIAYFDQAADAATGGDPSMQYAALWCVYPSRAELAACRKAMWLLPNRLCDDVERIVGAAKPEIFPLTRTTTNEELAEHGIPEDIARSLLSAHPGKGQLKIVRVTVSPDGADEPETFSFVMRPLGNSTGQLVKGFQGKAKYSAIRSALGAAMAYPIGAKKDELFKQYVGLPSIHVLQLMLTMGGSDAKGVAKKA